MICVANKRSFHCAACGATGIIDVRDDDNVRIQWHERTEAING